MFDARCRELLGLHFAAASGRLAEWRSDPTGALALLILTVAFGYYVAQFTNYSRTYGSLGTVVAFRNIIRISNRRPD